MIKKIISVLAALSMLMSCVTAAYAENGRTELYCGDLFAEGGQELIIPVNVRNNTGFDCFEIGLEYDSDVLAPVSNSAVKGELLTSDLNVTENTGEIVFSAAQSVTSDGQLFTYKFKVNDAVKTRVVSPVVINVSKLLKTIDGTETHVENEAFGCSVTVNKDVVTAVQPVIGNTEAIYDGQPHMVDVTLDYDVAYQVLYNGSETAPTDAGTYTVEAVVTEEGYTGSAKAVLTINPAVVDVHALDAKKGAGGTDPELKYTTAGTLYGDDTFSGTLSREPGEDAGTYNITQGTLTLGSNYTINYTSAIFTIVDQKPQNVTVEDIQEKTYGDAPFKLNVGLPLYTEPDYAPQISYKSDNEAVATVDSEGTVTIKGAGTALIEVTAAANGDYAEEVITKDLIVSKKDLTVTANTMEMTYGDPIPDQFITYDGLVNGDTAAALPVDLSGIGTKPTAGTYAYTPKGIVTENYNILYIPGTLTVNKRVLSVGGLQVFNKLADGTTAGVVNTSSAVLSGKVDGDNVTLDTSNLKATFASAAVGENVAVTISGIAIKGTDAANYKLATTTFETTASIKEVLTAAEIAAQIGGGSIVGRNAEEITLPSVPSSHTITLASSSVPEVISTDGKIHMPAVDTPVTLIFTVTNKADETDTANTAPITVMVYSRDKVEVQIVVTSGAGTVTGSGLYDYNSEVTVTGIPESNYRFNVWVENGEIVWRDSEYTFKATKDVVLEAVFVKRRSGGGLSYNGTSSAVKASIASGTVIRGTEVELSTATSGATIYYTTDNSTPTTSSMQYTKPITISENMTIKAISVKSSKASSITTLKYMVRNPKVELKSGASGIRYMADYGTEFLPDSSATRFEVLEALDLLFDIEKGTTRKEFSDVSSSDAELVNKFASVGIISGYDDGTFGGNRGISRAEFVTILNNTLGNTLETGLQDKFSDISNHWGRNYINSFAKLGYVSGYPEGTFLPDNKVTRAEVVSVLNRIAGIKTVSAPQKYEDVSPSHWAFGQIMAAAFSY